MAKRSRPNPNEYTWVHYGIDPSTCDVRSVWQQRNGTLTMSGADGQQYSHHPLPNQPPEHEIVVVWGLTDIISVQASFATEKNRRLEALKEKASKMRTAKKQGETD